MNFFKRLMSATISPDDVKSSDTFFQYLAAAPLLSQEQFSKLLAQLDVVEKKKFLDKFIEHQKTNAKLSEEQKASATKKKNEAIEESIKFSIKFWKFVQSLMKSDDLLTKSNETFIKMNDEAKMDYVKSTSEENAAFMKEYPIVARYAITMGQFSRVAFERFLKRVHFTEYVQPSERTKEYMSDQWIRRQADYLKFLWEEYTRRKRHFEPPESQFVWEHAYKLLKGELDDFTNRQEEIKKAIEMEKKQNVKELTHELLNRVVTGTQKFEDSSANEALIQILRDKVAAKKAAAEQAAAEAAKKEAELAEATAAPTEQVNTSNNVLESTEANSTSSPSSITEINDVPALEDVNAVAIEEVD